MDDNIENVQVTAPPAPTYHGLSPLKAGLLYGGAAASVGGPIGLLVGLGASLVASLNKKKYTDKLAAYRQADDDYHAEWDREYEVADDPTKRLLMDSKRMNNAGWQMLAAGDHRGLDLIQNANQTMQGIISGDVANRHAEQSAQTNAVRSLVTTAAGAYRDEYSKNLDQFNTLNSQADRVLQLVADPKFDPNKPSNKAFLSEMLSTSVGGFYKDAPDALDAITQGADSLSSLIPGGKAAAGVVGALITGIKSQDFKMTREDYNRVALNLKTYAKNQAQAKMQQLSSQGQILDAYAKKQKVFDESANLAEYISGGEKELRLTDVPQTAQDQEFITRDSARKPPPPPPAPVIQNPGGIGGRDLSGSPRNSFPAYQLMRAEQWRRNQIGQRTALPPLPTN